MVSFGVKDGKSLFPGATRRARPAGRITNDMDAEFKLHPAESFVNKKACVGFPRFLEPVFLKKGKNVDKLYPSSKACLKTGVPKSMRV